MIFMEEDYEKETPTVLPALNNDVDDGREALADNPDVEDDYYYTQLSYQYDADLKNALYRLNNNQVSNDEFARLIMEAQITYNRGIYRAIEILDQRQKEEEELSRFDSDLKEQLRIRKVVNGKIKARIAEIKRQKKEERLRQQYEKAREETERLGQELQELENEESSIIR